MGFNGSTTSVPAVVLDLLFLKHAFRGRYLVIEERRGIRGTTTGSVWSFTTANRAAPPSPGGGGYTPPVVNP